MRVTPQLRELRSRLRIINGIQLSVQYWSEDEAASDVAWELASQLNYDNSPITAVANGNVVTVTGKLPGAQLNITTSVTSLIQGPAYWATVTGGH